MLLKTLRLGLQLIRQLLLRRWRKEVRVLALRAELQRLRWRLSSFAFLAHLLLGVALLRLAHRLKDALLVGVHLDEGAHLRHVHVLPVAEGDDLVEGEEQREGVVEDRLLVGGVLPRGGRVLVDDAHKEAQRLQVLQNVGRLGGDQHAVQLVHQRLVHTLADDDDDDNRTVSVSMKVCCLSLVINLEKAVKTPAEEVVLLD
ncbi:hypothetical protein TYRP_002892 [Tyrophagus putrescentiae]|nr:hypothetical protein TYRP_002892 [Tyrophagus putrescentiae]